jgi:hypothetical protein
MTDLFDNPRKADPKAKADPGNQYKVKAPKKAEAPVRAVAPYPKGETKYRHRSLRAQGYTILERGSGATVFKSDRHYSGAWDGWPAESIEDCSE